METRDRNTGRQRPRRARRRRPPPARRRLGALCLASALAPLFSPPATAAPPQAVESGAWTSLRTFGCDEPARPAYLLRAGTIFECVLSEAWCEPLAAYEIADNRITELPPIGERSTFILLPRSETGTPVPWHYINGEVIQFQTWRFPPSAYKPCPADDLRRLLDVLVRDFPDALSADDRALLDHRRE